MGLPSGAVVRGCLPAAYAPTWGDRPKHRTLLFADVHANLPALQATLEKAKELGVDSYIFLGDAVGYGPHPSEVLDILANLPAAILLQGNHDYAVSTGDTEGMNRLAIECIEWTESKLSSTELDYLFSWPIEYEEGIWMALHGAPVDPKRFNSYVYDVTYQQNLDEVEAAKKVICFFGHTHVPNVYRRTGTLNERFHRPSRAQVSPASCHLINPGSVGQPRDGNPAASFAVWDHASGDVTFYRIPYSRRITAAALKKAGLPEDLVFRLELGR